MKRKNKEQEPTSNSLPLQDQSSSPKPESVSAESPAQFLATDPPHLGNVNDPPPLDDNETTDPAAPVIKRRRGGGPGSRSKNKVVKVEVIEPTKDDVEDVQFVLEMVLYTPSEELLGFESPAEQQQLRMARIGARIMVKYLSAENSKDEYKLAGMLLFWMLGNCVKKFGGRKIGQRNNGSLRPQASGKNPLDAPISAGT